MTINLSLMIVASIASMGFSYLFSVGVAVVAKRTGIMDQPGGEGSRKVHHNPVPLLGGWGIFLSIALSAGIFSVLPIGWLDGYLLPKHLLGLLLGGLVLMIGGTIDDRKSQKPLVQLVWPVIASFVVISFGIGVTFISNPLGGILDLSSLRLELFSLNGLPYAFVLWADLFTVVWLMGMMFTTKFLDGLDGLASGVTMLGMVILFFLSISKTVAQPETAMLAAIIAGAFAGFLILNWHPAKLFLGQGGSLLCGYLLGGVAILSGGKIATALLIMGIPILDVAWVIVRRAMVERVSIASPDRKHLHYRLLDLGFSQRQVVLFLYLLITIFGITGLFLKHDQKVWALVVLGLLMLVMGAGLVTIHSSKTKQ